jgi:hypothetical protein
MTDYAINYSSATGAFGGAIPGASSYVYAQINTAMSDVTGDNTAVTIVWDSEISDALGEYNNTTGVFTAAAAGLYWVSATVRLLDLAAANTAGYFTMTGSTFGVNYFYINPGVVRDVSNAAELSISKICKLAAGETLYITLQVSGGTKVVDINGNGSYPDGWLSIFKFA